MFSQKNMIKARKELLIVGQNAVSGTHHLENFYEHMWKKTFLPIVMLRAKAFLLWADILPFFSFISSK